MNKGRLILMTGLALLVASPVLANSIAVVGPGQGLGGSAYSLEATADSGADKAFVETNTPSEETTFSAEFRVQVSAGLNLDVGRVLDISTAFGTNVPARNLKFGIQKIPNGNYRLWVYARNNATGKLFPYVVFNFAVGADTLARVEWVAASVADNDGIIRIYKNNNLISQRLDVPSNGQNIDRIRFGIPTGSVNTGAAGGTFKVDSVVLLRTVN